MELDIFLPNQPIKIYVIHITCHQARAHIREINDVMIFALKQFVEHLGHKRKKK